MKDRRYLTFPQLFALLILGGSLYLFLGSSGLHLWAQGRENPGARTIFTAAIGPLKDLAERSGIIAPLAAARERFHILKEIPFDLAAIQKASSPVSIPATPSKSAGKEQAILSSPEIREKPASPPESAGIELPGDDQARPPASDSFSASPVGSALPVPEQPPALEEKAPPEENEPGPPQNRVTPEDEGTVSTPYRILLMGDSLANSTATALVPLAEQIPEVILTNHGKVSSNLSNPVFTDWFSEVDAILEEQQFDTVMLMLGANAAQPISLDSREVLWDTPEWNRIYRERAAKLIAKLKAHTERVFWVGIPPMLKQGYRERMERQNQIIYEICTEQGINYLPIDRVMGDQNGKYIDYKTVEGRQIKLRLSDNIHYSAAGAEILSRHLLNEIYPELSLPENP